MKTKAIRIFLVLLVVFAFILIECNKFPVEPTSDTSLLLDVSFEEDHTPTLEGWRFGNPQLAQLVNEAPPEGGNWSLQLTADWAPTTGYVYRPVTNVRSGDIVKLSAYVRAKGEGGTGIIALTIGPDHYADNSKHSFSSDTVWNKISVIDTLELEPNDTLWVILSSPITEVIPFQQLFDLVRLEKLQNEI